jgi:putative oxidoreductase
VRRFFSTFAHGRPGLALLLLRLAAGVVLIARGFPILRSDVPADAAVAMAAILAGLLLVAGLWTPIAAPVGALAGMWNGLPPPGEGLANLLWGAVAVSLALIGPGAYSCDARLFGWQRIDVRDRSRRD